MKTSPRLYRPIRLPSPDAPQESSSRPPKRMEEYHLICKLLEFPLFRAGAGFDCFFASVPWCGLVMDVWWPRHVVPLEPSFYKHFLGLQCSGNACHTQLIPTSPELTTHRGDGWTRAVICVISDQRPQSPRHLKPGTGTWNNNAGNTFLGALKRRNRGWLKFFCI